MCGNAIITSLERNECLLMHNLLKTPTIGLVLLTLMMLTACGQKRDLYLPDEPENNRSSEIPMPATKTAVQVKD
mgnify:CR=1 FL=1